MFIAYILYQFRIGGVSVVLHSIHQEQIVFFQNGLSPTASFLSRVEADIILSKKDLSIVYIVDSIKNIIQTFAPTIFVSSPNPDIYKNETKQDTKTLWMPIWKLKELVMCRNISFQDIKDDKLQTLYDLWGGIPRQCLANCDEDNTNILE
ncbi:hypothetical protein DFA_09011 [Cavenderia fasciculata]|uniref:Uncharacterized protein n=1 Tax=Cavenderia fasciculata TaxID=261658 RepID=F4Q6G3_CACFS|nr:uncharacterized protein DFA_09011 [Cavenderia fasciculata]EGG16473.1 hypothetical protein DFA_09011 [Cavenderia fasciculata]|eukprot:XP_004354873.1 hypothetical protein DFA_09011 [Cavenderia fasciculata]